MQSSGVLSIPGTESPNQALFETVVSDWLEHHPEALFHSPDPQVLFMLHSLFPSHWCETVLPDDPEWLGFWAGWLPGDITSQTIRLSVGLEIEDGTLITELSDEDLALVHRAVEAAWETRFSGVEASTPTGTTPDA